MEAFLDDLSFFLERLNWLSALDILLVTLIFFGILLLLRGTQAVVLLRGVVLLIVLIGLLTSWAVLPAFSWLVRTTLPALVIAIPVIFAPEIRRALERIGRASALLAPSGSSNGIDEVMEKVIAAVLQMSVKRHGALIVLQRLDGLQEEIETGVSLDADVSSKVLQQIFFPNTPLHDGAVIISGNKIVAAACVLPLASGDLQVYTPSRQLGLRHRAGMGVSEATDAVAIIVSEETGGISIANDGQLTRKLDAAKLEEILLSFFGTTQSRRGLGSLVSTVIQRKNE